MNMIWNRRQSGAASVSRTGTFRALGLLFGLILVIGIAPSMRAAGDASAPLAVRASVTGIDNFGQVDARLYRGAQPNLAAYAGLKALGIGTVVRLNGEGQDVAAEKAQVESLGMKFVNLPWSGLGEPSDAQIGAFLNLMRDSPTDKIFVHCREGADRTGVMVALYRMTFDHWTTAQAVSEMKVYHYHHMLLPHLQHFVQSFPVTTPVATAAGNDLSDLDVVAATLSR
jgi:protein tyrosine/serine phosphatase